jgi:hypothetical protein
VPAPPGAPATYTNYRGYEIELINSISGLLNFRYELVNPEDGHWGKIVSETADWNGLIEQAGKSL